MTEFNEAKFETLQDIYGQGEVSASDLAYTYGLTLQNASTRLRRYSRQGLLGRWREGREYIYYITDRGIERLKWLTTNRASQEWLNYANKRCPVEKTRVLEVIADDERNYEYDFDDTESNEYIDQDFMIEDEDEVIEFYEVDEDDDEDLERYPLEEEDVDDLYSFLKNIKRCRVYRPVDDSIDEDKP